MIDKNLTTAQRDFIEGYFEDIHHDHEGENVLHLPKERAIEKIARMHFSDASPASVSSLRVARNLNEKGYFSSFDEHDGRLGVYLQVQFSEEGAKVLLDMLRVAMENKQVEAPSGP